MTLLDLIAAQVPRAIRNRGAEYLRRGEARLLDSETGILVAEVQGISLYRVEIRLDEDCLVYHCTCSYYSSRWMPCEHVWAALLLAQGLNVLPDWKGTSAPFLEARDELLLLEEEEETSTDGLVVARTSVKPDTGRALSRPPQPPPWKTRLELLRRPSVEPTAGARWPEGREMLYVLGIDSGLLSSGMWIELRSRDRKKSGEWGKVRTQSVTPATIPAFPDDADRQILQMLLGTPRFALDSAPASRFFPSQGALNSLLPLICGTGRGLLDADRYRANMLRLEWDAGPPWVFSVQVRKDELSARFLVSGSLRREAEQIDLADPTVLLRAGFVVLRGRIGPLEHHGCFSWISLLRSEKGMEVPAEQGEAFLEELLRFQSLPMLELPKELQFEDTSMPPRPILKIHAPTRSFDGESLRAELSFEYEGSVISPGLRGAIIPDPARRRRILRDLESEKMAERLLGETGFRRQAYYLPSVYWTIPSPMLSRAVGDLTSAGWQVEAQGKPFRTAGAFKIEVTSGIDWFEMRGSVAFGDSLAPLPSLLTALRRRETTVQLDDGTIGILPEQWLHKFGFLAGLGTPEGDHLRFSRSQTGLLDALLATEPDASFDEVFERARARLRDFAGVNPADAPREFVGQLREYQREGLGWLHFLREFGFGGCLADDMGLGKTVQVLALLETRRNSMGSLPMEERAPSLVVMPRSLIFNWKQEAARFTPRLRLLDHTGAGRVKENGSFDSCDVVLTTYGTLRRDTSLFRERVFDYLILDEAQAIKNSDSASAKAARLLKGNHRLALSGTPVENHLGELWSLFEFLNPGMLGSTSAFRLGQAELRDPDAPTLALLAGALRPFILRRTKNQVARDLPEKTEQTLVCELNKPQRRLYNELRDHYRRQLTRQVERDGIAKSKIRILEALLRLRQAAIHPGLVDPSRSKEGSAKLEVLLLQLEEVLEEGHKALVFSQFTSMLSIVRENLDSKGIRYAYLDGKTRDRAAVVEAFQTDPECRLFLISLKAGGLGLNLTAAEYVFLLDPWWNPAVEAQAIDRTHRIGQNRSVFAYRLIASDTVEEKVLELQKTKRELADAIVNADNSLIRNLRPEDLTLLLS